MTIYELYKVCGLIKDRHCIHLLWGSLFPFSMARFTEKLIASNLHCPVGMDRKLGFHHLSNFSKSFSVSSLVAIFLKHQIDGYRHRSQPGQVLRKVLFSQPRLFLALLLFECALACGMPKYGNCRVPKR